jgi:hypothetical protein
MHIRTESGPLRKASAILEELEIAERTGASQEEIGHIEARLCAYLSRIFGNIEVAIVTTPDPPQPKTR